MARLPKNVRPSHYNLDLNLDLETLNFKGTAAIDVEVLQDTSSIVLHSGGLKIDSTQVEFSQDFFYEVTTVEANKEQQTINLHLRGCLNAGAKIILSLSFSGTIKENGMTPGLQYTNYSDSNGVEKRAYSTSCEPIGARTIFPCFDEPDFKATIASTVTINQDLACISNMDVQSLVVAQAGSSTQFSKRFVFNTIPSTSTYLICFVIGDFEVIESNQLHFPVKAYATRGSRIQHAAKMLNVAVQVLKQYENIFGLPYPLPKLDLVALPDHGALENWGCIVFGERFLLADPSTTSAKSWQMAVETLCHELAHQWFGNLVTMEWWDDLWLNEAFAEWAAFHVVDILFPEWRYWLHFVASDSEPDAMEFYPAALDLDSTRSSHTVYNPDASPDNMHLLFDNITYMKGATVLRMLSQFVGTNTFIAGIRHYLKEHSYRNATRNNLWQSLEESSGRDVKSFMQSWTECVGYPVLLLLEDRISGTLVIEQRRYLQAAIPRLEEDNDIYHVPLNISAVGEVDAKEIKAELLDSRKGTYSINLESYKLNVDGISSKNLFILPYPLLSSSLDHFPQLRFLISFTYCNEGCWKDSKAFLC